MQDKPQIDPQLIEVDAEEEDEELTEIIQLKWQEILASREPCGLSSATERLTGVIDQVLRSRLLEYAMAHEADAVLQANLEGVEFTFFTVLRLQHAPGCDEEGPAATGCLACGKRICPHDEPFHFHKGGCPACSNCKTCESRTPAMN